MTPYIIAIQIYLCFVAPLLPRVRCSPPDAPVLTFEQHIAQNLIKKDLSTKQLTVSFTEGDYFPFEPNHLRGRDFCKRSLKHRYRDFVYALAEHHKCDISHIADVPVAKLDGMLYDSTSFTAQKSPGRTRTANEKSNCKLAKIGAYCPAYLLYAECIFKTYLGTKNTVATRVIFPGPPFMIEAINERFIDYLQRSKDAISLLLDEAAFRICRFVNTACALLHPQFSNLGKLRLQHMCTAFDVFTPLEGFESLYDQNLPAVERSSLASHEGKLAERLYFITALDAGFSPLGLPHDVGIGTNTAHSVFMNTLCKQRCEYHAELNNLTASGQKLSPLGYTRQAALCAKLLITCPACPSCEIYNIRFEAHSTN